MAEQEKKSVVFQEIKVKGNQLLDKVREIIEGGNARRVVIKKEDRTLLEFPLSVGVGSATAAILLAPTWAALGAVAALVTDVHIVVEQDESEAVVKQEDSLIAPPSPSYSEPPPPESPL